uniref:Ovule protein n=1 Tax=Haemonchus contortus TaxID=6289 RepID=A0A7I4Z0G8_HAECO
MFSHDDMYVCGSEQNNNDEEMFEEAVETKILVHDIRKNYSRKPRKQKKEDSSHSDALMVCDLMYMFVKFYDQWS